MTAIATPWTSSTGPLARLTAGAAKRVIAALKHIAAGWARRRDMAMVASFDDRMLADIGLTRSDVRDAVAARAWDDPTLLLRARALERRLSRRGMSFGFAPEVAAPPLAPGDAFRQPPTDRPARFAT